MTDPGAVWTRWSWDPTVLLVAALAVASYGRGLQRLHPRVAIPVIGPGRIACFLAGAALAVLAVVSPLEAASEKLFSAHMAQHLVLGLAAPLLIVAGAPVRIMLSALDAPVRQELRHLLRPVSDVLRRSSPAVALAAVAAHTAAFWAWHVPAAYDAAADHDVVHVAEHASLFATGLLLWWVVVAARWQARSGMAVLYLFLAGLQAGAMAALLTLAPEAVYSSHAATTGPFGLTPLEDQQLAGAIMWVPGGLVYTAAAVILFVRWLEAGPARHPFGPERAPLAVQNPRQNVVP